MKTSNLFQFATVAQINYFSQIGRLIAEKNYNESIITIQSNKENENVLCVLIPSSYGQYADIASSASRQWRISEERCVKSSIKYVLAIANDVIVGVFELAKDKPTSPGTEEHRRILNMEIADIEVQMKLLGRKVDIISSQQVVRYTYLAELDK